MPIIDLVLIASLALAASYVQACAGFSFSILFVSTASSLGLLTLWELAELASYLMILNAILALRISPHRPDFKLIMPIVLAMAPATAVGVWLLLVMDAKHAPLALMMLGAVTLIASFMLLLNFRTRPTESSTISRVLTGMSAGLLGGMLAAPGPPLVLSLYRQPKPAAVMRVSLLAILLAFGVLRQISVQWTEPTTLTGLTVFLWCAPLASLGALVGTKFPPPLSDANIRRISFVLLCAVGALLLFEGYWQLVRSPLINTN